MPTLTPNLGLSKPATGDLLWGATLNADLDLIDSLVPFPWLKVSTLETPSTTLHVVIAPGQVRSSAGVYSTYAGATVLLTASLTYSLYLNDSGTLVQSTSGFPASTNMTRLAVVVTGGSSITSVTDKRTAFTAGGVDPATVFLPLAGGTFLDASAAVVLHTGTTNGVKLGGAVTEKLGFYGAAPVVQPSGASQAAIGTLTTVTLTDSTGGTSTTTLNPVGVTNTGDRSPDINSNFASLASQVAHAVADFATVKALVNQLRSDLVTLGGIKGSA